MNNLDSYALIEDDEFYVENHDPHIIDINAAKDHLEGDVEYVGYWYVYDAAGYVFKCNNPDRSKGHKDYVILKHRYNPYAEKQDLIVCGYDQKRMEEISTQSGLVCRHCNTVIWSLNTHDYHGCNCTDDNKVVIVDGGMDYTRTMVSDKSDFMVVRVDHLNKQLTRLKD